VRAVRAADQLELEDPAPAEPAHDRGERDVELRVERNRLGERADPDGPRVGAARDLVARAHHVAMPRDAGNGDQLAVDEGLDQPVGVAGYGGPKLVEVMHGARCRRDLRAGAVRHRRHRRLDNGREQDVVGVERRRCGHPGLFGQRRQESLVGRVRDRLRRVGGDDRPGRKHVLAPGDRLDRELVPGHDHIRRTGLGGRGQRRDVRVVACLASAREPEGAGGRARALRTAARLA